MVEFAEFFSIKSGTHNYNFEGVRGICGGFALAVLRRVSELLDCFEIRDEQVRPQGPFVRLIDDNDTVSAQHGIRHEFANDHSVREIFYPCRLGRFLVEADSITNEVADRPILLCCDTVGEGGGSDLAWLGYCDHAVSCQPRLEDVLWHLCESSADAYWSFNIRTSSFSGPSLPKKNRHFILPNFFYKGVSS